MEEEGIEMSIYYCAKCDEYKDNDHSPCTEINGELWCEDCAAEAGEHYDYAELMETRKNYD